MISVMIALHIIIIIVLTKLVPWPYYVTHMYAMDPKSNQGCVTVLMTFPELELFKFLLYLLYEVHI